MGAATAPWEDFKTAPAQRPAPAPADDAPWADFKSAPAAAPRKLEAPKVAAPAKKKDEANAWADALEAFGNSTMHAFTSGIPGSVGDIQKLVGDTFDRVTGDFGPKMIASQEKWAAEHGIKADADLEKNPVLNRDTRSQLPTSAQIRNVLTETPIPGTKNVGILPREYEAKTDAGKVAGYVGNFTPAVVGAPGPIAAALRVAGSAGGSKTAETIAKILGGDELVQQWAALAGGLTGFKAGETAGNRGFRVTDEKINRAVERATEPALRRTADLLADQSGTVGAPPPTGPRPGRPPMPPKPDPISWTMAQDARLTPKKFEKTMAPYIRQGVDPFEFQGYGPEVGVAKLQAYSRMPGETGTVVREALDGPPPELGEKPSGARYELQERALKSLDEMAGRSTSVLERELDLQALQKQMQPEWEPVLKQNMTRKATAQLKPIIDRIVPDDFAKIVNNAQELGHAEGFPAHKWNAARKYQYIKRAVWNYAERLAEHKDTAPKGAAYKNIYYRMNEVLHDKDIGIPGYADLDNRFSTIQQAHDAMVLGQRAMNKGAGGVSLPADRVAYEFGKQPEPVKPYYQTGAAQTLYNQIAGKTEGYDPGNIARDNVAMQKLEAIFGREAAAKFIDSQRLIHKDAGDYNAIDPSRNSVTAKVLAHGADGITEAARAARGGPAEMALKLAQSIADHLSNEGRAARNEIGPRLMKKMDAVRMQEFRDQLVKFEEERRAAAIANFLASGSNAQQQQPGQ